MTKLSYSEASTLSACEQQWWYRYAEGAEEESSAAMTLGTLLHVGTGEPWLHHGVAELPHEWEDAHSGETLYLADFPEEVVDKAEWLLARWNEHYGPPPADWEIVSIEDSFTFQWGSIEVTVRTDGLVRFDGKLWLRETKSYGRNTRLELISVSPQETIYLAGCEAQYGERPHGILFDGIYTYQWVPEKPTQGVLIAEAEMRGESWPTKKAATEWAREQVALHPGIERPAADSFNRLWTDRSQAQINGALDWLESVAARKTDLLDSTAPIVNIGPLCNSCYFKPRCYQDLLGIDAEVEIEVEE